MDSRRGCAADTAGELINIEQLAKIKFILLRNRKHQIRNKTVRMGQDRAVSWHSY